MCGPLMQPESSETTRPHGHFPEQVIYMRPPFEKEVPQSKPLPVAKSLSREELPFQPGLLEAYGRIP